LPEELPRLIKAIAAIPSIYIQAALYLDIVG